MSGITVTGGIQGLGGFTVVQPEYFSPILLFQSNENGAWYDPSDYATMFQDNVGATPVTAAGQSVGLILDKSKGLVIGPELVTNGTFDTDTSWTKGAGWTITGGAAVATSVTGYAGIYQNIGIAAGRTYRVTVSVTVTSGTVGIGLGNSGENIWLMTSASGTYSQLVTTSTLTLGTNVYARGNSAFTGTVDSISVKLVPGNHAAQSTTSQRPILGRNPIIGTRNLLTYTEQFNQNTPWIPLGSGGATVSANVTTAPDGSSTADKLVVGTGTGNWYVANYANITVTSGQAYTFSVYVKSAELNFVFIRTNNNSVNIGASGFIVNLTTGDITYPTQPLSPASAGTATSVGNGWWRITATSTANATATPTGGPGIWACNSTAFSATNGSGPANFTGDGISGIYVWGAQFEIGSIATAYQKVVSQYDVTESGIADAYYLAFDGSDDNLVTNSVNFTSTTAMSVFSGVTKTTNSGVIVELSANYTTNSGDFTLQSSPGYTYGSNTADAAVGGFVAPVTSVVTGLSSITNDTSITRVNGTQLALSSADQGAGSYGNYPIYIGRRGGSTLPFKGRIYALIIRGAETTNPAQVEAWINERTGAYTEGQYALSLDFVSQQYTTETII